MYIFYIYSPKPYNHTQHAQIFYLILIRLAIGKKFKIKHGIQYTQAKI